MAQKSTFLKNPRLKLALLLGAVWLASWALLAFPGDDAEMLGLPLITWSHISLGVLAVVVSVCSVFLFERWEHKP